MKILLFTPMRGQHVRNAFFALADANMLHSYHTKIAFSDCNVWLKLLIRLLPNTLLTRRQYPAKYAKYINSHWAEEFLSEILKKIHLERLFKSLFDSNKQNIRFDKSIAKYLYNHHNEIDAVYGYEDACCFTFRCAKSLGIKCIYELPIGYWRAKEEILSKQILLYPEWELTMNINKEPKDKLLRKDEEISLADFIIVPSEFVLQSLNNYPSSLHNVHLLQYGAPAVVNNQTSEKMVSQKLELLFCGSLSQRKGLADIFEVYKKLDKGKFELTIIGRGNIDQCKPLKEGLKTVNYIPNVSHDELLRIMCNMDIMIFPSHFEGFALVIFDAMSQGLPVITTTVTSGPIKNGIDGWIVEPNDTDGMLNLLVNLEKNRQIISYCSKNAILTAASNSWENYRQKLVNSLATYL